MSVIVGYVDIHTHLLPAVDDGPPDLEQALAMARSAAACGIDTIAATPHLHPDFPRVHAAQIGGRCRHLQSALEHAGIRLQLVPAAEVSLTWAMAATDELLALASYGQRGTDLLIESPFPRTPGLASFIDGLRARGYRVILAHPERSAHFRADPPALRRLVEEGVLLQVNAESLLQDTAPPDRSRLTRDLLTEGLAHVVASDAHRATGWRPITRLVEAVQTAATLVGPERARWMSEAVPRAILSGEALPPAPPIDPPRRRRWIRRPRPLASSGS